MLVELRIRNIAVIDQVVLPLAAGLNVLTGETGAGKSLIVGALGLLLGERAASDRVRVGAERASAEGVFDVRRMPGIRQQLDERGIDVQDDELLVLKREIAASGRSRAWVNATPVTAAVLSEIGAQLVSVHGQHDSRLLLEPDHQRELFDAYAGSSDIAVTVRDAFGAFQAAQESLRVALAQQAAARQRADYLRFVVQEIEAVAPVDGELDALDRDITRLANASELQALASNAVRALSGEEASVSTRLADVRRTVQQLVRIDPSATAWHDQLEIAVDTLRELAQDIEAYGAAIESDPAQLRALEARRDSLLALQRKYGPTVADVLQQLASARDELALVDDASRSQSALARTVAEAGDHFTRSVAALSAKRASGVVSFASAVTSLLPELGMPDGRFDVALRPYDVSGASGAEAVEFSASLNAGTEVRALSRIASGGELSRVMLALSTVLAQLQHVPTLVFDEVDNGIGGAVAWQVGSLMRRVAGHHQVLAISHLAQIAARAHHHIVVRKSAVASVTSADTDVLDGDRRVAEIARMLGGDAERAVSRAHAEELLERGAADDTVVPAISAMAIAAPETSAKRYRRGKPV